MKRILILTLALLLAVSLGCGKDSSQKEKETKGTAVSGNETGTAQPSKGGLRASLIDPVSKKPVDINTSPYVYVYENTEYYFETEQNMKVFMDDPKKFLK